MKGGQFPGIGKVIDRINQSSPERVFDCSPTVENVVCSGPISDSYCPFESLYEELSGEYSSVSEKPGITLDSSSFLPAYRNLYWSCFAEAMEEKPNVKPVALAEPLKIRVISKGPPTTYFVLKPLQRYLWGLLQNFWNFELTGNIVTDELINKRFSTSGRFQSGDYVASTDEVNSWCSEVAAEEMILCFQEQCGHSLGPLRDLVLRALTGHVISGELQRTGQLMGSIISFPFLCIINFALIRASFELSHGVVLSIEDTPCWINGDDCLTQYSNSEYPVLWRALGDICGLSESLGKTYDSSKFCSINSRFFHARNGSWEMMPYINMGLLGGLVRSSISVDEVEKDPLQLGSIYEKFMEHLPPQCVSVCEEYFLYKHRKVLKTYPGPWGLPHWLCGLGVGPVSTGNLALAAKLRYSVYATRDPPSVKSDAEWVTHRKILDLVREICPVVSDVSFSDYEGSETYGQAYMAFFWHILFHEGWETLVKCSFTDSFGDSRRLFLSLIRVALKCKKEIAPLSTGELRFQKKEKVLPIRIK